MDVKLNHCDIMGPFSEIMADKTQTKICALDDWSRDSGVELEGDFPTEVLSPECVKGSCGRRVSFTDLEFSPIPDSPHRNSPLSFRPLRSLNFDTDSPISTEVVSPLCLKNTPTEISKIPSSWSSLFNAIVVPNNTSDTPKNSRLATQLDALQIRIKSSRKRVTTSPDKHGERTTHTSKRPRVNLLTKRCQSLELPSPPKYGLDKDLSENEAVMKALDRVSEDTDLISDGSKACCLPTIPGKHQDLKSITPETVAKVLNHEYDDVIENVVIVDCRYPYEFEGGHIKGAKNYYTRESIMENLVLKPIAGRDVNKRTVLIFHCEFSSERGPKMSRFLRAMDRDLNKDRYPELFYPEIYLLHGGYKNFYQSQKEFCYPQTYMPMHHDDYKEDLRQFRVKSKSWAGEKAPATGRPSLRRGLRF